MKVADLVEGQLYAISNESRVCVILWKGNYLDIIKTHVPIGWDNDKAGLKGRPALYCGEVKNNSNVFKQGWWKSHRFLINGDYYNIHGSSVRNVVPFTEEVE